MSRATEDLLDLIHLLTATGLKDELERAAIAASQPKTIEVVEDGVSVTKPNPAYSAINPQLIDKALKFLKDNGVDAPAKAERVDNLAKQLGELDLDDEALDLRTAH